MLVYVPFFFANFFDHFIIKYKLQWQNQLNYLGWYGIMFPMKVEKKMRLNDLLKLAEIQGYRNLPACIRNRQEEIWCRFDVFRELEEIWCGIVRNLKSSAFKQR